VERGALVLATTHYAELKEWASGTDGVENAAVGFDPELLAPTYVLALGRPGPSHALEIAERLGLDHDVVAAARGSLSPQRRRVEDLLSEAARAERDARRAREEAARLRADAEATKGDAQRREVELREALEAVRAGAAAERRRVREEAEEQLAGYRSDLDALRGEIRSARRAERERELGRRRAAPDTAADGSARERDRRLNMADERLRGAAGRLERTLRTPERPQAPLAVGDVVRSPALGVRGTIAEISGGQAEVHGGGLRVRVALERLERDAHARSAAPRDSVVVNASPAAPVEREIDVRGKRADEVREQVRAYVDAAHLARQGDVTIIHGRATGALRAAVRDELDRHPLVERHEPASADGATHVLLAASQPPVG
jgi:DNA mismatch repair protein MutS2